MGVRVRALILAGGKGTRLRPYTTVLPKPLMPVGDYPILEIILRQLRRAGVTEVIIAIGHLGQLVRAIFGDGARLGLKITYSLEEKPLGTAGPIALVLEQLGDDFIVMNGDLLTTLDYRKMVAAHREAKAAATIGLYTREVKIDFGVIEHAAGQLTRYVEKPIYTFDVSMGVNVCSSDAVRRYVKANEYLDIPDLMSHMRDDGLPIHCFRDDCFWLDIGRVDDYQAANNIFESRKAEFLPAAE